MIRKILLGFIVVVLAAGTAHALTVDEVLELCRAGYDSEEIIRFVELLGVDEEWTVDDWVQLRQEGCDEATTDALMDYLLPADGAIEYDNGDSQTYNTDESYDGVYYDDGYDRDVNVYVSGGYNSYPWGVQFGYYDPWYWWDDWYQWDIWWARSDPWYWGCSPWYWSGWYYPYRGYWRSHWWQGYHYAYYNDHRPWRHHRYKSSRYYDDKKPYRRRGLASTQYAQSKSGEVATRYAVQSKMFDRDAAVRTIRTADGKYKTRSVVTGSVDRSGKSTRVIDRSAGKTPRSTTVTTPRSTTTKTGRGVTTPDRTKSGGTVQTPSKTTQPTKRTPRETPSTTTESPKKSEPSKAKQPRRATPSKSTKGRSSGTVDEPSKKSRQWRPARTTTDRRSSTSRITHPARKSAVRSYNRPTQDRSTHRVTSRTPTTNHRAPARVSSPPQRSSQPSRVGSSGRSTPRSTGGSHSVARGSGGGRHRR